MLAEGKFIHLNWLRGPTKWWYSSKLIKESMVACNTLAKFKWSRTRFQRQDFLRRKQIRPLNNRHTYSEPTISKMKNKNIKIEPQNKKATSSINCNKIKWACWTGLARIIRKMNRIPPLERPWMRQKEMRRITIRRSFTFKSYRIIKRLGPLTRLKNKAI